MKNCVSHCAGDTSGQFLEVLFYMEFFNICTRFQETGWKEAVPHLPQLFTQHLKKSQSTAVNNP